MRTNDCKQLRCFELLSHGRPPSWHFTIFGVVIRRGDGRDNERRVIAAMETIPDRSRDACTERFLRLSVRLGYFGLFIQYGEWRGMFLIKRLPVVLLALYLV